MECPLEQQNLIADTKTLQQVWEVCAEAQKNKIGDVPKAASKRRSNTN